MKPISKETMQQFISQLDADGCCDITDRQVEALIRNYAALESERDALAAYTSQLQQAIKSVFPQGVADECGKAGFTDSAKVAYETATCGIDVDAFLREQRAKGVDAFVEKQLEIAGRFPDSTSAAFRKEISIAAKVFAAQLRAGEAV